MSTPNCPNCNAAMIRRTGKFGPFYGCVHFPKCKGVVRIKRETKERQVHTGPRPAVTGSPEQTAIWASIEAGVSHVLIEALAGTGKSFTCRHAMWNAPKDLRQLYLAFNREIVDEFRADAPANATVATLNGIGNSILNQNFRRVTLDNDKVDNLIEELYKPTTPEELKAFKLVQNAVSKLVALCQGHLINNPTAEDMAELSLRYDVEVTSDIQDKVYALVPQVLTLDRERTAVISYNDQLWLPVVLNLPCDKFDRIYVDEAQDLNACQHQLVLKLLAPGGKVIVVGDSHQAIYGFRGSDVDSIPNFRKLLEQTGPVQTLPLTVTRRCAKRIVAVANQYVPELQALPDAPDGEIIPTDATAALDLYAPGDMVLCRVNAPLASIAYRLLKKGVKAVIRGRDIGQHLIALINRLDAKSVNHLLVALDEWKQKELEKIAGTRREETLTEQINDKVDCIYALSEDCTSVTEVLGRIASLFDNNSPKGAVILSSIHRAKGLEANRVFWFAPDITCKCPQDWQATQERNLRYVACTRAKRQLFMVAKAVSKTGNKAATAA